MLISLVFFRLALDACYVAFVAPSYFAHFLLPLPLQFSVNQYLASFFPILLVSLFAPHRKSDVRSALILVVLMFVLLPLTSVFGLDHSRPIFPVFVTTLSVLLAISISAPLPVQIHIPFFQGSGNLTLGIALLLVLGFIAWSHVSGATAGFSLDPEDIYHYRREQSEVLDIGPIGHLNVWTQKVFALWLFCLALHKRRWILVLFTYLLFVYFYGITSARIHLFLPLLAVLMWAVFTYGLRIYTVYLVVGAAMLSLLPVILLFDLEIIGALVLRRALFVPASATFEWFDFFSSRPHVLWSDRLLAGFVSTEYTGTSLPFYIGGYLAPDKGLSFNNGLVSSGYAHAGLLGVLLYVTLVAFAMRVANALVRQGAPTWIVAALLVGPMRTAWADSDLPPALVTHGILVALVVIWLQGRHQPDTSVGQQVLRA